MPTLKPWPTVLVVAGLALAGCGGGSGAGSGKDGGTVSYMTWESVPTNQALDKSMAKLQGAAYTHYTACGSVAWRRAAGRLLAGQRL